MLAATMAEWGLFLGGVALVITAAGTAAAGIIGALGLRGKVDRIDHGVRRIDEGVRTLNGATMGELADADETRRVELIPPGERTPMETEHVAVVPPTAPASRTEPPAPT